MCKKVLSVLCALALVLGLLPASTLSVGAAQTPGAYQVGFARVDINPYVVEDDPTSGIMALPLGGTGDTWDRLSTYGLLDDNGDGIVDENDGLKVTCIAISDEDGKTILLITGDFMGVYKTTNIRNAIIGRVDAAIASGELTGILPLYPCSIFLYAMPFAVWGKGNVRRAACGYVCTLGLLGGLVNFVYPANILSNYSCLSFAGFHTFFYHGAIVFTAALMLSSGYHSFRNVTKWYQLLLPAMPALIVSIPANLVNYSAIGSDYMFFKLNSFFLAPIGAMMPNWVATVLMYVLYLVIHAVPYLPSFFANRRKVSADQ